MRQNKVGKSDPYVFNFYAKLINYKKSYKRIAFFGNKESSVFTNWFDAEEKEYFDLELGNWNINTFPYNSNKKYDLIVCTRVAYFSKHPKQMLKEFNRLLNKEGIILIDWGLGDHWRFKNFKIGWKKDEEHEYAYNSNNHLWSTFIDEDVIKSENFKNFTNECKKFNYHDVKSEIYKEVDVVLSEKDIIEEKLRIKNLETLFLWPEFPQLYKGLILEKNDL